jgi:spore germination protein YaaH
MSKVLSSLLVVIAGIGVLLAIYNISRQPKSTQVVPKIIAKVTPAIISPQKNSRQYLFIPYWAVIKKDDFSSFDALVYFGLGVNEAGIELNDKGYEKLTSFISFTPNAKERILAIRMVDKTINATVIKNAALEDKIASQAVSLALKNKFDGVLLDYETSAFGFESTTNNIALFYKLFAKKAHDASLKFYVSLYGDTYFESRPFDVKTIGEVSDKVLIMAYDFSKSGGNPGPNFPLTGKEKYGYDFSKMVDNFQKDILNEKLVIIFGYFGYDWRVDSKGNSMASGIPMSTNEITKELITKCLFKKCNLERVSDTSEPFIEYADDSGENHIVWFEDSVSINKKREFLKTKGILQTAAWAYSYF